MADERRIADYERPQIVAVKPREATWIADPDLARQFPTDQQAVRNGDPCKVIGRWHADLSFGRVAFFRVQFGDGLRLNATDLNLGPAQIDSYGSEGS